MKYLVLFCQFHLKILSKNQILTPIKGRNSVANLRETMICNTNVDLVNDNVYTKFGLNRSIRFQDIVNDNVFTKFGLILSTRSQDIEQKPNSDVNQGP